MRFSTKSMLCVLGLMMVCAGPAIGDVVELTLSELSSDETSASVLDARIKYKVIGTTLEITVFNDTSGTDSYKINEIYFNAVPAITGLTMSSPASGWTLNDDLGADGFGSYDFALIDGVGLDPAQIDSGEHQKFVFTIAGVGPFSAGDFAFEQSTVPPGSTNALAALKFVQGPGGDSAYGATPIPAPASILLGAMGLAMVGWVRKRAN